MPAFSTSARRVSFGLGSYCMAMALKLRTMPIQTGAGRPARLHGLEQRRDAALVLGAVPFATLSRSFAGMAVPVLLALLLGWFMFRGAGHRRLCRDHHAGHAGRDQPRSSSTSSATPAASTASPISRSSSLFGIAFDAYSRATLLSRGRRAVGLPVRSALR